MRPIAHSTLFIFTTDRLDIEATSLSYGTANNCPLRFSLRWWIEPCSAEGYVRVSGGYLLIVSLRGVSSSYTGRQQSEQVGWRLCKCIQSLPSLELSLGHREPNEFSWSVWKYNQTRARSPIFAVLSGFFFFKLTGVTDCILRFILFAHALWSCSLTVTFYYEIFMFIISYSGELGWPWCLGALNCRLQPPPPPPKIKL